MQINSKYQHVATFPRKHFFFTKQFFFNKKIKLVHTTNFLNTIVVVTREADISYVVRCLASKTATVVL